MTIRPFRLIRHYARHYALVLALLVLWQAVIGAGLVPDYLLPSPWQIIQALIDDAPLLAMHAKYTLATAFIGTLIGLLLSFVLSILMDLSRIFRQSVYPLLLLNQTIPTIAIAPLLVIWLGYGIAPKVVLVVLSVFFPMTIALLDGYRSVSADALNLFRSMNATTYQTYRHLKIPSAMGYFFTGLKVALSYALISAVVAEWLGGYHGLGVYMTRVRKSYELDNMFAVIFLISCLTLLLIALVKWCEKRVMAYQFVK
ncbi:ABC transporter permease [Moraxella sp. FZLJ2107]|uniref:ABC transporter permease n=1 Tax=unclassified Moraxella TaxID=2685852 RepID=UPI0020C8A1C6|nr:MULTISPECIES: ABC transporter permease [unclassified Moraxella]UTO05588.1 ABC transporter permease [Moraxella sp. FZLJ2107]UTO22324.1 ABC transporter permease [Moraxella sp. FZLJ2109]